MSLRSSQLFIQKTPKMPNETNNKEELVNIIRTVVKEELKQEICIWKQLKNAFGNSSKKIK